MSTQVDKITVDTALDVTDLVKRMKVQCKGNGVEMSSGYLRVLKMD